MFIDASFPTRQEEIEMDITGIAKSHQANSTVAGKKSFKKD